MNFPGAGHRVEASIALAIAAAIASAGFVLNDARRREVRLVTAIQEREASLSALSAALEHQERTEDQLRQAQKMEAVGQLTGGLAHDFNNMLAVIVGSLSMLKRRSERGETQLGNYVELALQGAERAANLTQRLLAFSRQQPLAPEVVHLNKILPGLSELLRRTIGEMISSKRFSEAAFGILRLMRTNLKAPSSIWQSMPAMPCLMAAI